METLEKMAEKGSRDYLGMIPTMVKGYPASKDYAIKAYRELPFGPTRKEGYEEAWKIKMIEGYMAKMREGPELSRKWKARWTAKMKI